MSRLLLLGKKEILLMVSSNCLKKKTNLLKNTAMSFLLHFSYPQSMAKPLGQPSVVFTIGKAWDPSLQALMILAGRNQSVQNI